MLAYSYFLPGENPQWCVSDDPQQRLYARLNKDIRALNAADAGVL